MGKKRKVQNETVDGKEGNASLETSIGQDKTSTGQDKTSTGQEKTCSHADHSSNPVDAMNIENTAPSCSSPPPEKIDSKGKNVVIRRSGRLKSSASSHENQKVKPVVGQVSLVESEKEEALDSQQVSTSPVLNGRHMEEEALGIQQLNTLPVVNEGNLGKKIDYIVQAVDGFKSQTFEQVSKRSNDSPSSDLSYKNMYIDSQKKIEALMEKHYELVRKLEFANGKIDAYEKMQKVMATSKEVVLFPRLDKDADAIGLSPQTVQGFVSAAAPGAPNDQSPSTLNADDDHKVPPKQKNTCKRKKAKS